MNEHSISQQEAETLLESTCITNNYLFFKPVIIIDKNDTWKIISNHEEEDNNAWLVIDKKTKYIVDQGFSINMNYGKAQEIAKKICDEKKWNFDGDLTLDISAVDEWLIKIPLKIKISNYFCKALGTIYIGINKKTGKVTRADCPLR
jgi:hypothetical protein